MNTCEGLEAGMLARWVDEPEDMVIITWVDWQYEYVYFNDPEGKETRTRCMNLEVVPA